MLSTSQHCSRVNSLRFGNVAAVALMLASHSHLNRQDAKTPRTTRDLRSLIFNLQSRALASWRLGGSIARPSRAPGLAQDADPVLVRQLLERRVVVAAFAQGDDEPGQAGGVADLA